MTRREQRVRLTPPEKLPKTQHDKQHLTDRARAQHTCSTMSQHTYSTSWANGSHGPLKIRNLGHKFS